MPITRPPTMSQEETDRLVQVLVERGAKITLLDPRVTAAQSRLMNLVGVAVTGFLGWGVNSLVNLNDTMKVVQTQNVSIIEKNTAQDTRIEKVSDRAEETREGLARVETHVKAVDGRVTTIEARARIR